MAWTVPQYSRSHVNGAGRTYVDPESSAEDRELALAAINNWRAAHAFPLNAMQMVLRKRAKQVDTDALVSQRLKRLPSIAAKLRRFDGMDLARMHDLGGCRAVVSSLEGVDEIVDFYLSKSRSKHEIVRVDDYIRANPGPKDSGYRSVHLVHKYKGSKADYEGLRVEVQIRSQLQHAWATAVETVDTFTQQALKASHGEAAWLRFFSLMGSALAIREGTPTVPGTPDDPGGIRDELRVLVEELEVIGRLEAYGAALDVLGSPASQKSNYSILELDANEKTLLVREYNQLGRASEEYQAIERALENMPGRDVVLVSVDSVTSLRRAYPNYFLDTTAFLEAVVDAIN